jgi:flagellar biosynthetic protein FliR
MMTLNLQPILTTAILLGLRVSGLVLFAPFFGHAAIPPRVKACFVFFMVVLLYPLLSPRLAHSTLSVWTISSEVIVGLAVGLTTNAVFEAAMFAGQILSVQMGYSLVNIIDPTSQIESTVMSVFHQTIAMLIFIRFDVHHWILRTVVHSFDYLPPGELTNTGPIAVAVLQTFASVMNLGLQIAAPVLAATMATDFALGMLSKASPQLPLMMMGPSLKSLLGIIVLSSALCYWPSLFDRFFSDSIVMTDRILHLAH